MRFSHILQVRLFPDSGLQLSLHSEVSQGSIIITSQEEIKNRLIDSKPENEKDNQYAQG
jgi:hypothetical protein